MKIKISDVLADTEHWGLMARVFHEYSSNHPESKQSLLSLMQHIEALFLFKLNLEKMLKDPVELPSGRSRP